MVSKVKNRVSLFRMYSRLQEGQILQQKLMRIRLNEILYQNGTVDWNIDQRTFHAMRLNDLLCD